MAEEIKYILYEILERLSSVEKGLKELEEVPAVTPEAAKGNPSARRRKRENEEEWASPTKKQKLHGSVMRAVARAVMRAVMIVMAVMLVAITRRRNLILFNGARLILLTSPIAL